MLLSVLRPPPNEQARFSTFAKKTQATIKHMELNGKIAATLNASPMSHLLEKVA